LVQPQMRPSDIRSHFGSSRLAFRLPSRASRAFRMAAPAEPDLLSTLAAVRIRAKCGRPLPTQAKDCSFQCGKTSADPDDINEDATMRWADDCCWAWYAHLCPSREAYQQEMRTDIRKQQRHRKSRAAFIDQKKNPKRSESAESNLLCMCCALPSHCRAFALWPLPQSPLFFWLHSVRHRPRQISTVILHSHRRLR
jgi:hypothetical protein